MTERELRCYRNKMRRVRELRRKAVMAIVTLLVVLGFALSYNALVTQATSEIEDISYKYFTSIEISSGDTLWSIAEEYADAQYYASGDFTEHNFTFKADELAAFNGVTAVGGKYNVTATFYTLLLYERRLCIRRRGSYWSLCRGEG